MNLNREQDHVVVKPLRSTVKVLAGAGTGKTRVLVARYLKFVFDDGIPPDRLLALTFTKKAAAEMQERIFQAVIERGDKSVLRQLYGAWIMNFHQFAYRLIKENAPRFGIDPEFSVASEIDIERVYSQLKHRFESGAIDDLPEIYEDDMPPPNKFDGYFTR